MTGSTKTLLLWAMAALWGGYLLYAGVQAPPAEPMLHVPGIDKVAHAVAYAILAALAQGAAPRRRGTGVLPVVAGAGLHGALLEALQFWAPGRSAEFLDLLADVLGAWIGAAFVNGRRRNC